jgi:hypothetical protein
MPEVVQHLSGMQETLGSITPNGEKSKEDNSTYLVELYKGKLDKSTWQWWSDSGDRVLA